MEKSKPEYAYAKSRFEATDFAIFPLWLVTPAAADVISVLSETIGLL